MAKAKQNSNTNIGLNPTATKELAAIISQYSKLDTAINKYNSMSQKSTSQQLKYKQSLAASNTALSKYLTSLNGSGASIGGYIKYLMSAEKSTAALSFATKVMDKALNFGVSFALNIVTSKITEWINASETARKKAIDLTNVYIDQKTSLDDQIKKYQELKQQLDDEKSLNENAKSIKQELLDIQTSLVDTYGEEAKNLDLVNGQYEEQLGLLDNISKKKADAYVAEHRMDFSKAKEYLEEENTLNFRSVFDYLNNIPKDKQDKLRQFITSQGDGFKASPTLYGDKDNISLTINTNNKDSEELLHNFYKELEQYGNDNDIDVSNLLDKISVSLSKIKNDEKYQENKSIYDAYINAEIICNDTLQQLYTDTTKAVEDYNQALISGEGVERAKADVDSLKKKVSESTKELEGSQEVFDNIFNLINSNAEKSYQIGIEIGNNQDANYLANELKEFTEYDLNSINFDDADISNVEQKFLNLRENLKLSEDDTQTLISTLVKLGYVQENAKPSTMDHTFRKSSFSGTEEQYNELDTYQSKIDKIHTSLSSLADGSLSAADISSMIDEFDLDADKASSSIQGLRSELEQVLELQVGEIASSLKNMFDSGKINEKQYNTLVTSLAKMKLEAIDASIAVKSIPDAYNEMINTKSDIEKIKNVTDYKLSDDTKKSLLNSYPQMQNIIPEYEDNVADYEIVLSILNDIYKEQELVYNRAKDANNLTDEEYFNKFKTSNEDFFSSLSINYDKDISKWKTMADAKLAIQEELIRKINSAWSKCYAIKLDPNGQYIPVYTGDDNKKDNNKVGKNKPNNNKNPIPSAKGLNAFIINSKKEESPKKESQKKTKKEELSDKNTESSSINNYDWSSHSIDLLTNKLSNLQSQLENTTGWKSQLAIQRKIIAAQKDLVDGYSKQKKAYKEVYIKATKSLSEKEINAIEKGKKFNSGNYSDKKYKQITDAVSAFEQWKSAESNYQNAIFDSVKSKETLIQNEIDRYNAIIEKWNARLDNASSAKDKNKILNRTLAAQKKEIEIELKLAKTDEDRIKLKEKLKGYHAETAKKQFDNIEKEYSNRTSNVEGKQKKAESSITLVKEKGQIVGIAYYKESIRLEKANQNLFIQERNKLQDKLDRSVRLGKIEKGSDEWYEMRKKIMEAETEIINSTTAMEKFKNSIRDLKWESFDTLINKIKEVAEESDFLIQLMSKKDMFDESGQYTKEGLTTQALHGSNYNVYYQQAEEYKKAIKDLDQEYANDKNNTAYTQRRNELLSAQRDAIKNAESEKQSMISLAQEGIKAEIDAYSELTETKKKTLDTTKKLEDYNKTIQEKSSNISKLQKKLNALEGDNSEEAQKTIRELKAQLKNAQEDLSETQDDKAYDDSIEALDKSFEDYKTLMEAHSKETETLFTKTMNLLNANSQTVASTIVSTASAAGYSVSETLSNAWTKAGSVLSTYNGTFQNSSSAMLVGLSSIKTAWLLVAAAAEEAATKQINALQGQNDSGSSAVHVNKEKIEKLLKNADGKGEITDKTSALNRFVYDLYGTRLSKQNMIDLASLLGVSGVNDTTIVNNEELKSKILNALKSVRFDNSFGIPEKDFAHTIQNVNPIFTRAIAPDLFSNVSFPDFSNINSSRSNMSQNLVIEQITLPNVVDTESFISELQSNPKVQRMIQEMTLGQINGSGSLSKYKY